MPLATKICGVTRPHDAALAAQTGVDAIGLNFSPVSPRRINSQQALTILRAVPAHTPFVGVFTQTSEQAIIALAHQLALHSVQLHGGESVEYAQHVIAAGIRVTKAFPLATSQDVDTMAEWLARAHQRGVQLHAVLLDARVPGLAGGTGQTIHTKVLDVLASLQSSQPPWINQRWILAGGLTPANLAARVQLCPLPLSMVDTASGVESAPGIKDPDLIRRFVKAANQLDSPTPTGIDQPPSFR